jgi:hypothetical protein
VDESWKSTVRVRFWRVVLVVCAMSHLPFGGGGCR